MIFLGLVVLCVVIAVAVWARDERSKYNSAATMMQMEGYTELEILDELGPPPSQSTSIR